MLATQSRLSSFLPITCLQPKYFDELTHSFAQRRAAISRSINRFRTLSIATEVVPPFGVRQSCHHVEGVKGAIQICVWLCRAKRPVAQARFSGPEAFRNAEPSLQIRLPFLARPAQDEAPSHI
jgi:hypothetical protein